MAMASPFLKQQFITDASVVLVGCRGAGKRTLGFIGALHLGRRLVTEDHYFAGTTGLSRAQYLQRFGQEAFLRKSTEVLKHMLEANRSNCVIECGVSSLSEDAQQVLRQFCQTNPVVYILRDRDHVLRLLGPDCGSGLLEADPAHRACSNFEYYNLEDAPTCAGLPQDDQEVCDSSLLGSSALLSVQADFKHFLEFVTGNSYKKLCRESPFSLDALPPEYRQCSYALRLRLSYLMDMDLTWQDLEAQADTVELIIDHWPPDLYNVIAKQVALIRRKLAVPIIYHVEETPRGERKRSETEKHGMDAALLDLGLRLGVEYLSLDINRRQDLVAPLIERKGPTRVIGNLCSLKIGAPCWMDDSRVADYDRARSLSCDIVRMIRFCSADSEHDAPEQFKQRIDSAFSDPKPPLVTFEFSVLGVRLPLQSPILSPVKHESMETRRDHLATVTAAHHGVESLFERQLMHSLEFYSLGANVSYSLSPSMHQAAYKFAGLSHTFTAVNCSTMEQLYPICSRESFGGGSITAPFKTALFPRLKLKSPHATAIGAINVLLPLRGPSGRTVDHARNRNRAGEIRDFFGDNTDWSSIHSCLRRAISPRNFVRPSRTTGLVIGAGGMARAGIYALLQLGCRRVFIHNRTQQHADDVARHFNEWAGKQPWNSKSNAAAPSGQVCFVIPSRAEPWPTDFDFPTMIISCVPAIGTGNSPAADFSVPKQWLGSPTGGVAVEVRIDRSLIRGHARDWGVAQETQMAREE